MCDCRVVGHSQVQLTHDDDVTAYMTSLPSQADHSSFMLVIN